MSNSAKCLSVEQAKVFVNIYTQLDENGYLKLNNSGDVYMPLVVERLFPVNFEKKQFQQISFAHYFEQCGDLMADPEMIFLFDPESPERIIPIYFKNDSMGKEEESIAFENGECKGWRKNLQSQHQVFADMWLNNIMQQQNISI